jgi:hypothetical protein
MHYLAKRATRTLAATALSVVAAFSSVAYAAPENPWRVPAPELKQGKYLSIIIDQKQLKKAVAGSNGNYLFSEKGIGVQSLAIVGTAAQITEFLLKNQQKSIESQIKTLPKIYMGISPFKPQERFTGVFPMSDVLSNVAGLLTSTFPTPDWATIVAAPDQLNSLLKNLTGMSDASKAKGNLLYMKFSYLPEDRMVEMGSGKVSFKEVLHTFQKQYRQR